MKALAFFTALLLCMPAAPAEAQTENLTDDTAFFQQQKILYQHWLDRTGLGGHLRVQDLRVEPQHVRLYLGFHSTDTDSIADIWRQIKAAHEAQPGPTFEEALFFRMTNLMGLRQQAAVVEVYDTYDMSRETLFFRGIHFQNGRLIVEENNPKGALPRLITINPADIKTGSRAGKAAVAKAYTKDRVFEQVMLFVQQKYAKSPCDLRHPAVRPKPHEDYLRFDVSDLCREVVKEAENPTICRWLGYLGYNCNWTTRELLSFTFIYVPNADGFTLHLTLEGRVGSGYYDNVKRSGYMDMELDFKEELETYADAIVLEIKNHLSRQP
ncbi:MAG: hypothetical protein ABMA02_01445 [Saprospiraceae bacterium]